MRWDTRDISYSKGQTELTHHTLQTDTHTPPVNVGLRRPISYTVIQVRKRQGHIKQWVRLEDLTQPSVTAT